MYFLSGKLILDRPRAADCDLHHLSKRRMTGNCCFEATLLRTGRQTIRDSASMDQLWVSTAPQWSFLRGTARVIPSESPNRQGISTESSRLAYCRSRISSIGVLPPLSTLTILWTGLNPVSVISTI